jgi:hypothetical protein
MLVNASLLLTPGGVAHGHCNLHARRRAVAARLPRCHCSKFVARAAQAQANNQQIYLDLGSSSSRQLEQQRLCCALKCLCHVVCQLSTSRRQLNKIDRQNYNFRQSIRQPLLRKPAWISQSTYTPKSKHRKSMQTSTMQLK